jgi:chitinase
MSGKQSKFFVSVIWRAALGALFLTGLSHGQTTALTFRPVGAEYSLALDRIIMISSNPNLLHIYDPSSNADTTVRLSNAPLNFSVGPDGLHAAVAYTASVDYINLQSAAVERNYLVPVSTGSPVIGDYTIGKVVLGTTYFYILSSGNSGLAISVNLSSGAVTTRGNTFVFNGRYNSAINAIYAVQQYGYNLVRYDVSTGPISGAINSPYISNFSACGSLWFSSDESRIYTGCSAVFHASTDATKDTRYVSALSGLNSLQAFSESAAIHRIAAVPQSSTYSPPPQNDSEVSLFDSD